MTCFTKPPLLPATFIASPNFLRRRALNLFHYSQKHALTLNLIRRPDREPLGHWLPADLHALRPSRAVLDISDFPLIGRANLPFLAVPRFLVDQAAGPATVENAFGGWTGVVGCEVRFDMDARLEVGE